MAGGAGATSREERAALILERLGQLYPDACCSLDWRNPFELLVATMLSAQCTDRRVNLTTPALFARFPDAFSFAAADPTAVEPYVKSTGFYRNKARNIVAASRVLVSNHGGEVPASMEALLTLPGVARKTANVVLAHGFGRNDGVTVDTHVRRLSQRLGLTRQQDPVKIEADLMAILAREAWEDFSIRLIFHGRAVCRARRPGCDHCALTNLCPAAGLSDTLGV